MSTISPQFAFRSLDLSPWSLPSLAARQMRAAGRRIRLSDLERRRIDLESHLRESWPENHPVLADLARFGDAMGPARLRFLDLCDIGDGPVIVVAVSEPETTRTVRQGDGLFGGVLFTGNLETEECRVSPRVVRVICANGCVVPTSEVDEASEYVRESAFEETGDLAEAVRTGLSGRCVDVATDCLRTATEIPVRDPIRALREHMVPVPARDEASVRRVFRRQGEPTLFGAFNALTETARDTEDVRERVALERLAGLLLTADLREDAAVLV